MPENFLKRLVIGLAWSLACLCAHSALAASTNTPLLFTTPIQTVADWVTGEVGRLVSIISLAFFGMYLWRKRSEDKAERGLMYVIGTAIVLGAFNIIDLLGFQGATF